MLYWLGDLLTDEFGPFRLLKSRLVLSCAGLALGAAVVWWLLPRARAILPRDRGRDHSYDPQASIGNPTGAGAVLIGAHVVLAVLVVPWYDASEPEPTFHPQPIAVAGCVLLALFAGYIDDRSVRPWGEYRKGAIDLGIAFLTALAICQWQDVTLWVPFVPARSSVLVLPPHLYVAIATLLLWISINATNCTDGVDGLSGSLLLLAFLYLGALLYLVVGHEEIAEFLLLPHVRLGADWGILAFTTMGTLVGYLWHNANPSSVLMGDAGSRPLGLLLGVFALVTGNPFFLFVVAGVVIVNGGTGLLKVALLRFLKVGIFRSVRFPLHDHCRKNLGWSNAQVLMRFMILQAVVAPVLIVLFVKVR